MTGDSGLYDFFKDFAGPVATVIASITVAAVAIYFQRRQTHLAEHRLRLDLFEKRYAKLLDAKQLLEAVTAVQDWRDIRGVSIRDLYVSLDEGRFLLSRETYGFLKRICDATEAYLMAAEEHRNLSEDDAEVWRQSAEAVASKLDILRTLYAQIPEQFDRDLRIEAR